MSQHSIEEIQLALFVLCQNDDDLLVEFGVTAERVLSESITELAALRAQHTKELDHPLMMIDTVNGRLVQVNVELAALRAWCDAAVPLLRALVADALRYGDDWPWCQYCIHSESDGHAAECPVTLARALLAESEAGDGR